MMGGWNCRCYGKEVLCEVSFQRAGNSRTPYVGVCCLWVGGCILWDHRHSIVSISTVRRKVLEQFASATPSHKDAERAGLSATYCRPPSIRVMGLPLRAPLGGTYDFGGGFLSLNHCQRAAYPPLAVAYWAPMC